MGRMRSGLLRLHVTAPVQRLWRSFYLSTHTYTHNSKIIKPRQPIDQNQNQKGETASVWRSFGPSSASAFNLTMHVSYPSREYDWLYSYFFQFVHFFCCGVGDLRSAGQPRTVFGYFVCVLCDCYIPVEGWLWGFHQIDVTITSYADYFIRVRIFMKWNELAVVSNMSQE